MCTVELVHLGIRSALRDLDHCSLISALRKKGGRKGVASLCIGGGEATAMAIELIE